jgi:hypothetical protein
MYEHSDQGRARPLQDECVMMIRTGRTHTKEESREGRAASSVTSHLYNHVENNHQVHDPLM